MNIPDLERTDITAALSQILDPELGYDIVELGLIREIVLDDAGGEVRMTLTTPFCPWAGALVAQVATLASEAIGRPVKVSLLTERWTPPEWLYLSR